MTELISLTAMSPLDGRYALQCAELRPIFSEFGLMRFRLIVEVRWFEFLAHRSEFPEIPSLNQNSINFLNQIIQTFDETQALHVKHLEKTTNHDVKAIEYFLKEQFSKCAELAPLTEFIHFACTSEDINNLAYALMLKEARAQFLLPILNDILLQLTTFAHQYAEIPMLARTHGQAASPTTAGKEFANFIARLKNQYNHLEKIEILGKFNGAVGNFNAHAFTYPKVDWLAVSQTFVESFGLTWNPYTTQIEPHDYIATLSHQILRINTILIDLCRDIWGYISLHYFKQRVVATETGSSTMPHKVNPIDFENAEGNLGLSNAIFDFLARQLPTSRWQRDLVDSTLLRNLGVAFGHSAIAYRSLAKGLKKLEINEGVLEADLNKHWEVLAEAIQTVMRRYGHQEPYEQLKAYTRGKIVDQAILQTFILNLDLPESIKDQLKNLTPNNYTGLAAQLAQKI